jgi:hypothetical protein
VTDVQIVPGDVYCELRAWVESEHTPDELGWFASFPLWFRFPPWCEPFLDPDNGDPFLAALLFPAMLTDERLALPVPVSPLLRRHVADIQDIYRSFDPRLARIAIETPPAETSRSDAPRTANALFFSLGVDSFYSLLKNERDRPGDVETISHLISIHGFDHLYGDFSDDFPPDMMRNLERVAREKRKTLLPAATNARIATRTISSWDMHHGAVLASVALALGGLLGRITVAASTTYDQLYPWGTHPVLDPLWSTETLTVVHDGCEMGRIDKVRFVARSDLVLETLRLCPDYNCGKCIKCLPTIIDLMQAGALARCTTLPQEVDIPSLREAFRAYKGSLNVDNYERRLSAMNADNTPSELQETLAELLASEKMPAAHPMPMPAGRRSPFLDRLPKARG